MLHRPVPPARLKLVQGAQLNRFLYKKRSGFERIKVVLILLGFVVLLYAPYYGIMFLNDWLQEKPLSMPPVAGDVWAMLFWMLATFPGSELALWIDRLGSRELTFTLDGIEFTGGNFLSWQSISKWRIAPVENQPCMRKLVILYDLKNVQKLRDIEIRIPLRTRLRQWSIILKGPQEVEAVQIELSALRQLGQQPPALMERPDNPVQGPVLLFPLCALAGGWAVLHGIPMFLLGRLMLSVPALASAPMTSHEKLFYKLLFKIFSSWGQLAAVTMVAAGAMVFSGIAIFIYGAIAEQRRVAQARKLDFG